MVFNPKQKTYTAEINGNSFKTYKLTIELDEGDNVIYYNCNCPHDYSSICKHIVAVYLAIQDEKFIVYSGKNIKAVCELEKIKEDSNGGIDGNLDSFIQKDKNKNDVFYLIKKSSKNDLIEFIAEYGFKYDDFLLDLFRFLKKTFC